MPGRHIEHGVASAIARDLHNRASGLNHLAWLSGNRGNHARSVGLQFREAHPVLSDLKLSLRVLDLGFGGLQFLLSLIEAGARGVALSQKRLLAFEVVAGAGDDAIRTVESGLRGAQGVQLIQRLQFCNGLAGLHPVAQIDGAFDHASADPKPERGFVAWPHMPCQGDRFTEVLLFNGDGANRPDVWKNRFGFAAASRRESCESDNHPAKLKFRPGR